MAYNINTEDTNGNEYPLLGAYKGSFDNMIHLKTNYPTGQKSWFAFLADLATFVYWNLIESNWFPITGTGMPVFTASFLTDFDTIEYNGLFSIMGNNPGLFQSTDNQDGTMYQMVLWKDRLLTRTIDLTSNPIIYPEFVSDTDKIEVLRQEVEDIKSGTNYIMVYGIGTPTENALELQAAYDIAKTMPRYIGIVIDRTTDDEVTIYIGQTFDDDAANEGKFAVATNTIINGHANTVTVDEVSETVAKSTSTTVVVAPGKYNFDDGFATTESGIIVTALTGNADVIIDGTPAYSFSKNASRQYADNEAAISGGLTDGEYYNTDGIVKIVY